VPNEEPNEESWRGVVGAGARGLLRGPRRLRWRRRARSSGERRERTGKQRRGGRWVLLRGRHGFLVRSHGLLWRVFRHSVVWSELRGEQQRREHRFLIGGRLMQRSAGARYRGRVCRRVVRRGGVRGRRGPVRPDVPVSADAFALAGAHAHAHAFAPGSAHSGVQRRAARHLRDLLGWRHAVRPLRRRRRPVRDADLPERHGEREPRRAHRSVATRRAHLDVARRSGGRRVTRRSGQRRLRVGGWLERDLGQ